MSDNSISSEEEEFFDSNVCGKFGKQEKDVEKLDIEKHQVVVDVISNKATKEDNLKESTEQKEITNLDTVQHQIDSSRPPIDEKVIEKENHDVNEDVEQKPIGEIFKNIVENISEKKEEVKEKIKNNPFLDKLDKKFRDIVDASCTIEEPENNDEINEQNSISYININQDAIETEQDLDSKFYNMNHKKRGIALIFNQNEFISSSFDTRIGTKEDVRRLNSILTAMGFLVLIYDDLTYDEIESKPYEINFKYKDLLEESDCLMVFILTHGNKGNFILARDREYDLYEYVSLFTPNKIKALAGKPKLFFIQACRGTKLDDGVLLKRRRGLDVVDAAPEETEIYTHPIFADLLIAFSSHHNHFSFRNENGSWFIQELCNVLEKCDFNDNDITDILTMTNNRVAKRVSISQGKYDQKTQISAFYSTLVRKLYFKNI